MRWDDLRRLQECSLDKEARDGAVLLQELAGRAAEVRDTLVFDLPVDIAILRQMREGTGAQAAEMDYGCGMRLRVTRWHALVFVADPADTVLDLVLAAGRNFCVVDELDD